MRLKRIIVKNFRGYQDEHVINVEKGITTLVGKNDAGKSTILEALEIFFGDAKPELEDLNIHGEERDITFGCVFDDLPDEVTVDSTATTTLEAEYLLNEDGDFEVIKKFTCTEKTVGKPETIIRAVHPTKESYNDLLTLKISDLKQRGATLGVTPEDQRVNSKWRKAIWASADNLEARKLDLRIDDFDSKAKSIYANLEGLFPQYYIFKVDRQTSDSDSEAKDPMQLAVKEAQKEFQNEIAGLQSKIQQRVDEVADRALDKLKEMDESLASQLKPVLKAAPKWTFDYKIQDERGVSLNKRGSGTRRLVLLNFFRAEAERKSAEHSGNIIYAIEEPETSQHPDNQEMVIKSLLELADDDKRQVFITTHSPQLADFLPHESVRFIEFDGIAKNVITHEGEAGLLKAAESLGIHSSQKLGSARAVVLVEGDSDEVFLNHASKVLAASGDISSSLDDAKILVIPAGGCDNVPFWVQKLRLEGLGLPHAIFLDSDRMSTSDPETKNEAFISSICTAGKKGLCSRKREIENYIDPAITGVSYGDFDDAKSIIATANTIKPSKVMTTYWPNMTSAQIIAQSTYVDGSGDSKVEIVDLLSELLELVSE